MTTADYHDEEEKAEEHEDGIHKLHFVRCTLANLYLSRSPFAA